MAPENISTALAPFEQIDSELHREYSGIGLGLPLSVALVELHGGILGIESDPNVGTTVTVKFHADRPIRDSQSGA